MGNNAAFTAFEATVMLLYEKGVLTLDILDELGEHYRDMDIDPGGCRDIIVRGKGVAQVCMELIEPDFQPDLPDAGAKWDYHRHWDYWDEFSQIRRSRWGWR